MSHTVAHLRAPIALGVLSLLFVVIVARALAIGLPFSHEARAYTEPLNDAAIMHGEITCLPENALGKRSLECALGLRVARNLYVELQDSDPHFAKLSSIGIGVPVTVTGTLMSTSRSEHDIAGVLQISSIAPTRATAEPASSMLIGTYICLPESNGECVHGFHTTDDQYYALDTAAIDESNAVELLTDHAPVVLTGTIVPQEALSASHWHEMDIVGIMRVDGVGEM